MFTETNPACRPQDQYLLEKWRPAGDLSTLERNQRLLDVQTAHSESADGALPAVVAKAFSQPTQSLVSQSLFPS